jgi:hypothetical protein
MAGSQGYQCVLKLPVQLFEGIEADEIAGPV